MHNLSFDSNGNAELALADKGAWHFFGTVFSGPIPLEQAIAIACPWEGLKEQLIRPSTGQASGAYGIYRSDTGVEIGTCSSSYEMVQPREMFDFTQGLNIPGYESAGALKGGSVLFVSARVGEVNVLGSGDITRTYIAFVNSFDGSLAAQAYLTGTRMVCDNTVQLSLRNQIGRVLKFKHTRNVHDRIAQATAIVASQQSAHDALQLAYDTLAQRKITRPTYEAFLDAVFGASDATKTKNVKGDVTSLFADNDNNFIPEFAGTAYAALNAVSNYVDHYARVRLTKNGHNTDIQSQRFESAILGNGAELKTRALERILVLSDGSEACESAPIFSMPPRDVTPSYLPSVETETATQAERDERWNAFESAIKDSGLLDVPLATYGNDSSLYNNTDTSDGVSETGYHEVDWSIPPDTDDSTDSGTVDPWKYAADSSDAMAVLYTTSDSTFDLPGTTVEDVIERISDTVAVRRVLVPELNMDAQKQAYADAGCLAVSQSEWLALKR